MLKQAERFSISLLRMMLILSIVCVWLLSVVFTDTFCQTEKFSSSPSFGEGNGTPLQYSCLENPMDGGAWWPAVHGVAKSWTGLSDFTFTFHYHVLGKEMAPHSSTLAWKIPWTEEPGGLQSLGLLRAGQD